MVDYPKLIRRAALGQVAFLIWCLLFFGIDPLGLTSIPLRAIYVALAAVLLFGSLPGRFIWRGLAAVGARGVRWMMVVLSTGLPLYLIVIGVNVALGSYRIYQIEQDLPALWRLAFDVGFTMIQFLSLCINVVTLFAREPGSAGGSAA